jgi:hypothetical protein
MKICRLTIVFAAVILASLPVSRALAGERTVYRGTLEGAGEVVMELEKTRGTYNGRYFYPRYGVDIPLFGALDKLIEPAPGMCCSEDIKDEDQNAIWKGRIQGSVFRGK